MTICEIMESYNEILIDKVIYDGVVLFTLFQKHFFIFAPSENSDDSTASIYLYNDDGLDFPHILLRDETIAEGDDLPKGNYRCACLYEQESVVNTIVPYEDKIIDALDRLIELLTMNDVEKEREFQKEFMFYWNSESISDDVFTVYLDHEDIFSDMDAYYGDNNVRIIKRGINLSDIDSIKDKKRVWRRHIENAVYYIPITDSREIRPPHRGYRWSVKEIKNIAYGKQIEHISDNTFQLLKNTYPESQNLILVFGMKTELSNVTFAVRMKCNNAVGHSILEKILCDSVAVEPLYTNRKDYFFHNQQIGNDAGIAKKRVLIVGAGSLGSYITFELVKNGASSIKLYDGDKLEDENIFRWAYGGLGKGRNKATTIAILLNALHPEIKVEAFDKNIDEKTLVEEDSHSDLIIFTVGSSDTQLKFNRRLINTKCSAPVIYAWLEAGGVYSHILVVNYHKEGCFECLYTDENGYMVNNRAEKTLLTSWKTV